MPTGRNHASHVINSACSGTMLSMTKLAAFRVKPNCQPVERHFPDGVAHAWKVVRVVRDLVVGDEEVAVVFAAAA